MTEQEWTLETDIEQMVACLVDRLFLDAEPCNWKRGERKKRLFIYHCLRRIWYLLPVEYKAVFEMLDPDADEPVSEETRRAIWSAAERIESDYENLLFAVGYDDLGLLCYIAAGLAAASRSDESGEVENQLEQRKQAELLRDIFGNPFHSVALDPSWRTPTVESLAQSIYDERAFDRLLILADALEDAGCKNHDILDHCRQPRVHTRGCWVGDLLLGKS
jgi:hypothetical protein